MRVVRKPLRKGFLKMDAAPPVFSTMKGNTMKEDSAIEQKEILEMSIDELRVEVAMLRERCAQLEKSSAVKPQPMPTIWPPYSAPFNPEWPYRVTC